MAASLASVPLLQKKHCASMPLRSTSACASSPCGSLNHAWRAMADQVAAPAGEEIEITLPLGVPDVGPLAAPQADGEAAVVADHVFLEQGDGVVAGHGSR